MSNRSRDFLDVHLLQCDLHYPPRQYCDSFSVRVSDGPGQAATGGHSQQHRPQLHNTVVLAAFHVQMLNSQVTVVKNLHYHALRSLVATLC